MGDVLPAHLRGRHRHARLGRAAVVRHVHRAARVRARGAVGDRAARAVAAPDARERAARLRRAARRGARDVLALLLVPRRVGAAEAGRVRRASSRSCSRAWCRSCGAGCARGRPRRASRRRSRSPGSCAATAVATAATSCTPASPCCCSASRSRRPSSTRRTSRCAPARRARVDGFDISYVRATASADERRRSRSARCSTSEGRQARRDAAHDARLLPPPQDARRGSSGASSAASPRARSACAPGLGRDIWTVINPNLAPLSADHRRGQRTFQHGDGRDHDQTGDNRQRAVDAAVRAARRGGRRGRAALRAAPWPADFRFIVSPLATWIWIGAIITSSVGCSRCGRRRDRAASRHRRLRGASRARARADDAVRAGAWSC